MFKECVVVLKEKMTVSVYNSLMLLFTKCSLAQTPRYALTHARNRFDHLRADYEMLLFSSATAGSALACGGAQQIFPYVSPESILCEPQ